MSKFSFKNCWTELLKGKIELSHVCSLLLPWFMHSGMSLGIIFSQFQKLILILEDGKICSAYVEFSWSSLQYMILWVPCHTLSPDGCRFESLRLSYVGFNSGSQNHLLQALVLHVVFRIFIISFFHMWQPLSSTLFRWVVPLGCWFIPLSSGCCCVFLDWLVVICFLWIVLGWGLLSALFL